MILSLTNFNMLEINAEMFIWFDNYKRLFFDDDIFLLACKNTLIFYEGPTKLKGTLADLKAELAFLKSIQNGSGVRFATQDKQDAIINILKDGVKITGVNGKDVQKDGEGSGKKPEKHPGPEYSLMYITNEIATHPGWQFL